MPVTNNRNQNGVKDSANCYRNEGGLLWKQWTDFYIDETNTMKDLTKENKLKALEINQKENPTMIFKVKKVSGIYRMYYAEQK
jgi:hypothetical protein